MFAVGLEVLRLEALAVVPHWERLSKLAIIYISFRTNIPLLAVVVGLTALSGASHGVFKMLSDGAIFSCAFSSTTATSSIWGGMMP
jgi:ABC-type amino acid transport system permease subunit